MSLVASISTGVTGGAELVWGSRWCSWPGLWSHQQLGTKKKMTGKTLGAANEGAGRGKESSVSSCHAGEVLRDGDLPCAPSRADGALST